MNLNRALILALTVCAAPVLAAAQDIKFQVPAAPSGAAAAAAPKAFTEAQLTETYGWLLAKRTGLSDFQLSPEQVEGLIKGFSDGLHKKEAPYDLSAAGPQMDALMQRIQGTYLGGLKQQNLNTALAFFTKLKSNPNVVELPDGLRYEIVKPGDGAYPKPSDTVKVHYTGTLLDGTVFDSSVQRGQPAEFPLDGVIAGWTEGIQKINKGGKVRLYIPPQLAYGDDGRPGIPPASTLIFDVELLDFKPTAAAAAPGAPVPAPAPKQ